MKKAVKYIDISNNSVQEFEEFNALMAMYGNDAQIVWGKSPLDRPKLILGVYKSEMLLIPEGVVSIEGKTSGGHNDLEIGTNVLRAASSLVKVVIPQSLETIGKFTFMYYDKLKTVETVGAKNCRINSIMENAFALCRKLNRVDITGNIDIGDGAFYWCDSLNEVHFCPTMIEVTAFSGVGLHKIDLTNTRHIGKSAFERAGNLTGEIRLVDCYIGPKAFFGTGVTKATLVGDCKRQNSSFGRNVTIVKLEGQSE